MGYPTSFYLSPGQCHDLQDADVLLAGIEAASVVSDKEYDADERVSIVLSEQGIMPIIPGRSNRKVAINYDKELYKARHLIENFIARLKHYRAIATRYDKRAINFLGAIYLAASVVWLN